MNRWKTSTYIDLCIIHIKREASLLYMYVLHFKVYSLTLPARISIHLGVEFYLFDSHGGMNDRGSTCKFRNARSAFRNLHLDPLSFIPP